jgi:hypothetical protein
MKKTEKFSVIKSCIEYELIDYRYRFNRWGFFPIGAHLCPKVYVVFGESCKTTTFITLFFVPDLSTDRDWEQPFVTPVYYISYISISAISGIYSGSPSWGPSSCSLPRSEVLGRDLFLLRFWASSYPHVQSFKRVTFYFIFFVRENMTHACKE